MRLFNKIAIILVFACGAISAVAAPAQPNIVLLISDDHRWDGLGFAGNPNLKTPNLDRMAREGQWYREATIQTSTCSASRAAILTGLPSYRNGWYSNQKQRADLLKPDGFDQYNLLPKELKKVGYQTAFVGKWHLVPDPWNCGFDTIKHWMEAGAGAYKNPRLTQGRKRESKRVEGFTQTIFADDAISVLKEAARGETTNPLFLWVAFTAPHSRFQPNPEPISGMYDGKTAKELYAPTYQGDPTAAQADVKRWQHYSEAITAMDAQVGRIMDTVRNSSLSTNTLVVFIGDNGFMIGSRGMYGKYVPYEESLRVPMIMWGPDSVMGAKGITVTAAANSIDLSPTFVSLAGGTPPPGWTGRDLSPVIKDGKRHGVNWAAASYPDNSHILKHVDAYRVIRTPRHKLILWHPDTNKQPDLFDLRKDPAETTNLYGNPEIAEVQKRLEKQLNEYREKTADTQWDLKGPVSSFKGMRDDEVGDDSVKEKAPKKKKARRTRGQSPD